MGRWQGNARERLEQAALELFAEQGFAVTTVPEITARAGLTTRTFFRHFADKREVLFAGEDEVPALAARLIADAPAGQEPMAVVIEGIRAFAESSFEARRGYLQLRRGFIAGDEGLQERELRKLGLLTEAITQGFRSRGLDELDAVLTARTAVTIFSVAVTRWLDEDAGQSLAEVARGTLRALRAVTAGNGP